MHKQYLLPCRGFAGHRSRTSKYLSTKIGWRISSDTRLCWMPTGKNNGSMWKQTHTQKKTNRGGSRTTHACMYEPGYTHWRQWPWDRAVTTVTRTSEHPATTMPEMIPPKTRGGTHTPRYLREYLDHTRSKRIAPFFLALSRLPRMSGGKKFVRGVCIVSTFSGLQSRFGGKPVKLQVIYPQNGTAVLKGSTGLIIPGTWYRYVGYRSINSTRRCRKLLKLHYIRKKMRPSRKKSRERPFVPVFIQFFLFLG